MLQPAHPHSAVEKLSEAARYHDYRYASNPIGDGTIKPVPAMQWAAELHEIGGTAVIPLDNALALGARVPATTPGLLASFVHVRPSDAIVSEANATSQLFFVMRGSGVSELVDATGAGGHAAPEMPWQAGDLFTLPAGCRATHVAGDDAALYWVHDGPLLDYLGVKASLPRFSPTLYPRDQIRSALDAVAHDPASATANRVSVLLGNRTFPQTLTITHVVWAMFGLLPVNAVQAPHRHQSVAVDLVVDAKPGCFTLVGEKLDASGTIEKPKRFDWKPHSAFVTPPGLWHSHHNESGHPAHILPIQDAGLHTYLRTLDIRFTKKTAAGCEVVERAG